MLARTGHLFDEATQVTAGDSRWQGRTSDDYWAFVGPFGGATGSNAEVGPRRSMYVLILGSVVSAVSSWGAS